MFYDILETSKIYGSHILICKHSNLYIPNVSNILCEIKRYKSDLCFEQTCSPQISIERGTRFYTTPRNTSTIEGAAGDNSKSGLFFSLIRHFEVKLNKL